MKLSILICDDEPVICKRTKDILQSIGADYDIDICYLGESVLEATDKYDVILLDIEMPGINGLETAQLLRKNNCDVRLIFLTSHDEFMPEAFVVSAYRFLRKPLEENKLREAFSDIEEDMRRRQKVFIRCEEKTHVVDAEDIIYLAAYGDGTFIFTVNDGVIDNRQSLKYWAENLSESFFQIHRSYIVSFDHIRTLGKLSVMMRGSDEEIPVARRKYKEFMERYTEHIRKRSRWL